MDTSYFPALATILGEEGAYSAINALRITTEQVVYADERDCYTVVHNKHLPKPVRRCRPHPVGREEKLLQVRKDNNVGHCRCDWCVPPYNRPAAKREAMKAVEEIMNEVDEMAMEMAKAEKLAKDMLYDYASGQTYPNLLCKARARAEQDICDGYYSEWEEVTTCPSLRKIIGEAMREYTRSLWIIIYA